MTSCTYTCEQLSYNNNRTHTTMNPLHHSKAQETGNFLLIYFVRCLFILSILYFTIPRASAATATATVDGLTFNIILYLMGKNCEPNKVK